MLRHRCMCVIRFFAFSLSSPMVTDSTNDLPLVPLGAGDLIDRAVLEPGGNISFIAKKPEPEEIRYQEVLKRLDAIGRDLAALKH